MSALCVTLDNQRLLCNHVPVNSGVGVRDAGYPEWGRDKCKVRTATHTPAPSLDNLGSINSACFQRAQPATLHHGINTQAWLLNHPHSVERSEFPSIQTNRSITFLGSAPDVWRAPIGCHCCAVRRSLCDSPCSVCFPIGPRLFRRIGSRRHFPLQLRRHSS